MRISFNNIESYVSKISNVNIIALSTILIISILLFTILIAIRLLKR